MSSNDEALWWLLVVALVSSCLCLLVSMAMLGRKLTMMEYQQKRGINGTHRIQGIINVRTHTMRVLVGVAFGLVAILLLADASVAWRMWTNRTLFVVVPFAFFLTSCFDWFDERRQLQIEINEEILAQGVRDHLAVAANEQRTEHLQADHDAYRAMASEAIASLEIAAARSRTTRGVEAALGIAAVVPEHSSPVTTDQQATADMQTTRARLTAATLDLDLPARAADDTDPTTEPDHGAAPSVIVPESVNVITIDSDAAQRIADTVVDTQDRRTP